MRMIRLGPDRWINADQVVDVRRMLPPIGSPANTQRDVLVTMAVADQDGATPLQLHLKYDEAGAMLAWLEQVAPFPPAPS